MKVTLTEDEQEHINFHIRNIIFQHKELSESMRYLAWRLAKCRKKDSESKELVYSHEWVKDMLNDLISMEFTIMDINEALATDEEEI